MSALSTDSIAAISTPVGEGALAVIRVSGPEAIATVDAVFSGKMSLGEAEPRFVNFGRIMQNGRTVDEVLVTVFRNPASYTGEDLVEISCHGGVLVAAKILQLLLEKNIRNAEPGEFTQRAFLNGKMDLTQAEAVMDIIRAQTPLALRAAAEQLGGRIGEGIQALRETLLEAVAHLEAFIDFPEEGIDPDSGRVMLERLAGVKKNIGQLLDTAQEGRILREGVRLVICGEPNAGKSSLLNCLLGFDRAIVSATPGTTRDTIEELASLRGIPFRITDTAGLRKSADSIEIEGIERARRVIESADIVLELLDSTVSEEPKIEVKHCPKILVRNKSDLVSEELLQGDLPPDEVLISCKTGEGMDNLVDLLVRKAGRQEVAGRDSIAAINARHQACLQRALESLRNAMSALSEGVEPELIALDLRAALDAVGEVVGAVDSEEILGRIFGNFCIGK
ncbi:MAG: tRNA uridine-5-carboxymethylaminomethyl(34) synthesis GTPase MnmE [Chthoniobacterales bacterium]